MASSRCAGLIVRARARRTRSRAESLPARSIGWLFIASPDPSGTLTPGGFLCIRSSARIRTEARAWRQSVETAAVARLGILFRGYERLPPRGQGDLCERQAGFLPLAADMPSDGFSMLAPSSDRTGRGACCCARPHPSSEAMETESNLRRDGVSPTRSPSTTLRASWPASSPASAARWRGESGFPPRSLPLTILPIVRVQHIEESRSIDT